jgi:hypothetical protein
MLTSVRDFQRQYDEIGLTGFSLTIVPKWNEKESCWKKDIQFCPSWREMTKSAWGKEAHVAIRTGKNFGITAIDLDDVEKEISKQILDIFTNTCAFIQKTRKGYHAIYKYTPVLPTTTGINNLNVDIRNDSAILFMAPNHVDDPDGGVLAHYELIKAPSS